MAEMIHNNEEHAHSNTVTIMGRNITVEGGIYTIILVIARYIL